MGVLISISFEDEEVKKLTSAIEKAKDLTLRLKSQGIEVDIEEIKPHMHFIYLGPYHNEIWYKFHKKYPEANEEAREMGALYVSLFGSPKMPLENLVAWFEKWWDKLLETAKEFYSK